MKEYSKEMVLKQARNAYNIRHADFDLDTGFQIMRAKGFWAALK
jgi:hypothetical protein